MKRNSVAFAWEPLEALLDDGLEDLVRLHWKEVGVYKDKMPLACNWPKYLELDRQRILRVLSARLGERLIGYNSMMVMPHLHYSTTLTALCDAIYVLPRLRLTGAGLGLIEKAEADLAAEARPGWIRIGYHDRKGIDLLAKPLLKRGYRLTDMLYDKMVRA